MYRKTYSEQLSEQKGFLLNMQILADAFENHYQLIAFSPAGNRPTLKAIRHYRNGTTPSIGSVYILWAFQVNPHFSAFQDVSLIIVGEPDLSCLSPSTSYIILSEDTDINSVYDFTTDLFLKYSAWDLALQRALFSDTPLQDMLEASQDIFKNPLFVHDSDFYVLACPNTVEGMLKWMVDSRNGRPMVPLNVINAFKIDKEYLHTLKTRSADIFSAKQRGYRILYMNLWNGKHYEGRICVDELQSIIKPGDYLAIEYLSQVIMTSIKRRNIFWISMGKNPEEICKKILNQTITDEHEISRLLRFLGWGYHDRYIVFKLVTDHADMTSTFSTSAFGYIESQVSSSHAFFYDKSIVAIVNQTAGNNTSAQIVSDLASLLKEGLFKIGLSNEIYDFSQLHVAYRQASIALECGPVTDSTSWCYYFKDCALDYMSQKVCEDISSDYLCAKEIQTLVDYDERHNTKLNETLETYLNLERNVVQTAKALYIHRSTLFYRLDRIIQITGLDLNNPRTRLYLLMSYQILK
ncbi:MAG: PucR family transcriptional regulator [Ruminococcus sp.]